MLQYVDWGFSAEQENRVSEQSSLVLGSLKSLTHLDHLRSVLEFLVYDALLCFFGTLLEKLASFCLHGTDFISLVNVFLDGELSHRIRQAQV